MEWMEELMDQYGWNKNFKSFDEEECEKINELLGKLKINTRGGKKFENLSTNDMDLTMGQLVVALMKTNFELE